MTQHTPGPCKCRIAYAYRPKQVLIEYCPLHTAAPAMRVLLGQIARGFGDAKFGDGFTDSNWLSQRITEARALIAKIDGR